MKFTDNELKLSRRLHDALLKKGEPMEIREGDWVLLLEYSKTKPYLISAIDNLDGKTYYLTYAAAESTRDRENALVLLPSFERCREWLSERGRGFVRLDGPWRDGMKLFSTKYKDSYFSFKGKGATDLEAILSACVAVAEEE